MNCFHYITAEASKLLLFEDPDNFSSKNEECLEDSHVGSCIT